MKLSNHLLRAIHADIVRHAPTAEIVAARAHPGHLGRRGLLLRNGYVEVAETPPRRDALCIAEL